MSTLVAVPVRDCAIWLNRFLGQLEKLSDVSRVVFYCAPGRDPTLSMLKEWAEEAPHIIEIYEDPPATMLSSDQIAPVYQELREIMRDGDETHILSIDSDIMKFPDDLIPLLKKQKKEIIAPYVWIENSVPPMFHDVDIFRYKQLRFHPFSPPDPGKTFKLDSVGTCFLATREAFISTEILNPYPHRSFCDNARDNGFDVWADPRIKIYHLNKPPLGLFSMPLEVLEGKPRELWDRTPYIKKNGSIIKVDEIPNDRIEAFVWGRVSDDDKDFVYFK